MRPLGFEAPAKRLERSLVAGLIAGAALSAVTALVVLSRPSARPISLMLVAGGGFALGLFAGFGLAVTRPEFSPAPQREDGDAETGVPARVKPPPPTLKEKARLSVWRRREQPSSLL